MAQNKTIHNILEVVVGSADIRSSKQVKSGNLRKIATRGYTSNMDDAPEDIIRRNVLYILGQLYPHAVISQQLRYRLCMVEIALSGSSNHTGRKTSL